jgi:epoxyqueuosine reductase
MELTLIELLLVELFHSVKIYKGRKIRSRTFYRLAGKILLTKGKLWATVVMNDRSPEKGNMSIKAENYRRLKEFALDQGMSLFGVADITAIRDTFHIDPADSIAHLDRGVSMAVRLSDAVLSTLVDKPNLLYKHHYREANELLDSVAFRMTALVEDWNYRALAVAASQTIDWSRQIAHLSHKKVAALAGLGWLGRNNLLVTPQYGSRVRLVTVLTNMPLRTDRPLPDGCGTCRDCLAVCPAKAIRERQQDFDHQACYEQVRHFAKKENIGYYICGLCQKACGGKK